MEPNLHDSEPASRRSHDETARASAATIAVRAAAQASDLNACDRMIVALAVHDGATGLVGAELWLWDAVDARLTLGAAAEHRPSARSLDRALERVRFKVAPNGPEELPVVGSPWGEIAAAAWHSGEATVAAARPGVAQTGAVPLTRLGRRYGVIAGSWATVEAPEERLAALREIAVVAEAMLAAHMRERDARRAQARQSALAELARAVVSSLNLTEVLHAAARLAAQSTWAEGSAIWLGDGDGAPRLLVTFGPPTLRAPDGRALDAVVEDVIATGRPRWIERATEESLVAPDAAAVLSAFAVCPIAAFGRTLGALAVHVPSAGHRGEPSPFGREEREFLTSLTDLVAAAADGAERHRGARESEHRERELGAQLRHEARASALAALTLRAIQKARQPATSIRVFAARVLEDMAPDDPAREYLEIVTREAERLERLLGDPVEPVVLDPPRLRMESVNAVIQEALVRLGETLVRRRIRLLKRLASDVPKLLMDPARMRQVVASLLHTATEDIGAGGRVRIETRRADGHVVVEFAHDGGHGPGDALEHLFATFAGPSPGRTRVGLAVASQIVREHGGEIRVSAHGEWTAVVSLMLPIRGNDDRRLGHGERRQGARERRTRA